MTAICGFFSPENHAETEDSCARMRKSLAIYGPHSGEQWDDAGISLGIQRFHTLPEDLYDRQPLSDDRHCMLADIRLDNRPELAAEFGWSAEDCARRADADFAFAAWQKWQTDSFDKLTGDWAIAVWDRKVRTLTLARDFLGQRPLFYHAGTDEKHRRFFAFATMVKGLFALPAIHMAPDMSVLSLYMALAPMRGQGWFYRDIRRVEPGSITVLHANGQVTTQRWYDWDKIREKPVSDEAACIRTFREIFNRAVADRLRTTGGIASHLSSGFDSTAVACTAATRLAGQNKRLLTLTHVPHKGWQTWTPPGKFPDEGPLAAATAARFANMDHLTVDVGETPLGPKLDSYFYYYEFPLLNIHNQLWIEAIPEEAARRGCTVLLNAAMGNMTISRTGQEALHMYLWRGRFRQWLRDARALTRSGRYRWRGILYAGIAPRLPQSLHYLLSHLSKQGATELSTYCALRRDIQKSSDFRSQLRDLNFDTTYRPWRNMRDVSVFVLNRLDISGVTRKALLARYGMDMRDPTADRRLVEFSLSLPPEMWLRDGVSKWLYRQAFKDLVPETVMNLRKRGRQSADWVERSRRSRDTLKTEMEPCLSDPLVQQCVDTGFMQRMLKRPIPERPDKKFHMQYMTKFLRAVMVAHFIRKAGMHN